MLNSKFEQDYVKLVVLVLVHLFQISMEKLHQFVFVFLLLIIGIIEDFGKDQLPHFL